MTTDQLATVAPATVDFTSGGVRCEAWHFPATDQSLATRAGRPVVVMAHGLGGTKDSGLEPFARAFAAAGIDAFVFDYRGFGASDGTPRQRVRLEDQVADYRAAIDAAGRLDGVDRSRIVLWGVSLAGGHVLRVAPGRDDVAAVVAMVPMVDGLAAAKLAAAHHAPASLVRATGLGIKGRIAAARGKEAVTMPLAARPGELGALTLPGALEDYLSIAGPTWVNEVHADVGLELGTRKPAQAAAGITAPLLVQIADFDRSAPPFAAAKAAFRGKAEVRHYPGDHFDLFPGKPHHERAVAHAVSFLTRHLTPSDVEPVAAQPPGSEATDRKTELAKGAHRG